MDNLSRSFTLDLIALTSINGLSILACINLLNGKDIMTPSTYNKFFNFHFGVMLGMGLCLMHKYR